MTVGDGTEARAINTVAVITSVRHRLCDLICAECKGTICEFGNASHHDSEVVVVESDIAEEGF